MGEPPRQRRVADRRRQPRGGRRADDIEGFAPLVMLVGDGPAVTNRSEAILAKLRFGVTTSRSADQALRLLPELRPDLVVAGEVDGATIRRAAPDHLPIVVMDRAMENDPDALIQAILRTLRAYES